MKISGYSEFQQMHKLAQKDSASIKEKAERDKQPEADEPSDAVSISPEALRKGKLRAASDYRQDKVADVKARLESGTLITEESLRSGAKKMLEGMFNDEI